MPRELLWLPFELLSHSPTRDNGSPAVPPPTPELACPQSPQRDLFLLLERKALTEPAVALGCAKLLTRSEQRDRVLRNAFIAASERDLPAARAMFPQLADREWIGDIAFFAALKMAPGMPEAQARKLLSAVIERNPGVAVREVNALRDLPYGMDIWRRAARAAPDEAMLVASGNSRIAAEVREALQQGGPIVAFLAQLADRTDLDPFTRQRAAVCERWITRGLITQRRAEMIARNTGAYFSLLAGFRLKATGEDARLLDRVLENVAQVLFRWGDQTVQVSTLTVPEMVLLLGYGRSEEDEEQFALIFDKFLAPRLRQGGTALPDLHLRRFLVTAIAKRKFEAFVRLAGDRVLVSSMRGIETQDRVLEEAVNAAAIVDAVSQPAQVRVVRDTLAAELARAGASPRPRAIYGLLLARLAGKLAPDDPLRKTSAPFASHYIEPEHLALGPLFNQDGVCHQRHFFYNDEDGVESFHAFRAAYTADPAWKWEDHGTWVRVTAQAADRRSIEVYANVPIAERTEAADARIHALTALLAQRGIVPPVVVHRGHAFHVERTIGSLNPSARLVYLGSCRGMDRIDAVMSIARGAQIVATRSIGTHEINDPILKSLNDHILRNTSRLDWEQFWAAARAKVGHYGLFSDYIPPNRNSPAVFLAAYYDYLANGAD